MSAILDSAARLDKQRASDLDRSDAHAAAPVYPEAITQTAIEIGEEKLCADMEYLGSFISECFCGPRDPSWFGAISTHRLIADILLSPRASDEQLAQAAKELRKRYLDEHSEEIREAAERAMR